MGCTKRIFAHITGCVTVTAIIYNNNYKLRDRKSVLVVLRVDPLSLTQHIPTNYSIRKSHFSHATTSHCTMYITYYNNVSHPFCPSQNLVGKGNLFRRSLFNSMLQVFFFWCWCVGAKW